MLAIDMNLNGEFAKPEAERIEPYGLVDISYLTKILNAYSTRKRLAFVEFNKLKADKLRQEPPHKSDPQKCYENLRDYFILNRELPLTADWWAIFEYMWKERLTENDLALKDFFEEESQKIRSKIQQQLLTCSSLFEKRQLEMELEESKIRLDCRKLYVQKRITELFEKAK